MRKFTKLMLTLALLVVGVGGAKAEKVNWNPSGYADWIGTWSSNTFSWSYNGSGWYLINTRLETGDIQRFTKLYINITSIAEGAALDDSKKYINFKISSTGKSEQRIKLYEGENTINLADYSAVIDFSKVTEIALEGTLDGEATTSSAVITDCYLYYDNVTLVSTEFSDKNGGKCTWDSENNIYSWQETGNNTIRVLSFQAGVLSKFSKLHIKWSGLTSGASMRVLIPHPDGSGNYQYTSSEANDELYLDLKTGFSHGWGWGTPTDEILSRVTQIRIGGNSAPTSEELAEDPSASHSMTIDPSDIYLEADWEVLPIADASDWIAFSGLVNAGLTSLNAQLTSDISVSDGTMVGTSSNPYTGTFDGAGHTLTFNYDSSTSNEIAPFQYINNATISNLTTTGSINAQNIFGGIVGTAGGESTLNYCTSSMTLTANDNGDSNNGRVAGLVGRCADNATPVGTSITFNNCIFDGSISSTQGSRCCGLVSWARSTSVIANNCLIAPTSVTNGAENIAATGGTDPKVTPTNCYYTTKFGYSSQGTAATAVETASGALCYKLNGNAVPSTSYFFGQGKLNSSIVEDLPSLTSDASKKVLRLWGDGDVDHGYANPNGLLPDPANYGKLAWKLAWAFDDESYTNYLSPDKTGNTHTWNFSNKYLLTVGSAGATTLVLPFDASLPDGVKAYELIYTSGDAATAKKVNTISADKPVLINAEEGKYLFASSFDWNTNIDFSSHGSANASSTGYVTSNEALTGVYNTSMPFSYVPANAYVLQNGAEGLGFYKVAAENTIKVTSFRAYLTASTPARSLKIVFDDETTGISEVSVVKDKNYFNLEGQRVSKPTKGLYIMNGKKVIVKN